MVRYQVILAYDGTQFSGFQRQAQARTVQAVVETALKRLGWQGKSILAAGRTDTGVHAAGQVISFDLEWAHPLQALQDALNAFLPQDVAALRVWPVSPEFHPRFSALSRRYQYHIYCEPVRRPLRERYAWRVWPAITLERLQPAANLLIGTHDFAAFGTPPRTGGSTQRTVMQATWQPDPEGGLIFDVTANAFLYRMVRHLVAVQVAVAAGRLEPDAISRLLEDPHAIRPERWGLAPPQGLVLVEALYPLTTDHPSEQEYKTEA